MQIHFFIFRIYFQIYVDQIGHKRVREVWLLTQVKHLEFYSKINTDDGDLDLVIMSQAMAIG